MRLAKTISALLAAWALSGTAIGCGDRTPATPATQPGAPAAETPLAELTVADVAARIARGERMTVVDVNNAEKYAAGHVPGAIHMQSRPIRADALPSDRSTPLVFYCANEH